MQAALTMGFGELVPRAVSARANRQIFWVKKPASNLEKDFRDNLLKHHFMLSQAEADRFSKEKRFYIEDTGAPGKIATTEHVKAWRPDASGRVSCTLSDYWVDEIRNFKLQSIDSDIMGAAASIRDPLAREVFLECVRGMMTMSAADRSTLFQDLTNYLIGSSVPAGEVAAAIDKLEKAGHADNPYLPLIRARLAMQDYTQKSGPGYDTVVVQHLIEASRRMDAIKLRRSDGAAYTRFDAAVVNGEAARLFKLTGNHDLGTGREWLARWQGMSADERAGYEEGDVVMIYAPGTASVSARNPAPEQRELAELERRYRAWRQTQPNLRDDPPGGISNHKLPNRDVYQPNGEVITDARIVNKKRRGGRPRRLVRHKVEKMPSTNLRRTPAGKGGFDLIKTLFLFLRANYQTNMIANYLNRRASLESKHMARRFRVVPPKPAKIRAAIAEFLRGSKKVRDPKLKADAEKTLVRLRLALAESEAAWPGL